MTNNLSQTSQALNQETLASINFYQLPMKYMHHLIADMKFEVFPDISKAFDKAWHEDVIFK